MSKHLIISMLTLVSASVAQAYTCPEEGLSWECEKPLLESQATVEELEFEGIPQQPRSSGGAYSPEDHEGDYQASFEDNGAMAWTLSHPAAAEVLGMASVQGYASADITAGNGNASVYAGAKSEVAYGGVVALALDEKFVAIASAGAPIGAGGSITLFGFGGGFNVTITPDLATASKANLSKADQKGWRAGNSASVTLNTNTYGNINIIASAQSANCAGEISGLAKAGAKVVFRAAPAGGQNNGDETGGSGSGGDGDGTGTDVVATVGGIAARSASAPLRRPAIAVHLHARRIQQ